MSAKIAIAIIIVAFLAVYFTLKQGDEYKEFMKTAEKGSAVIVKKEEKVIDTKNQRKQYWITYTYNTADGNTHTSRDYVEYEDVMRSLREGQQTTIYYNRNNPSESYLAAVLDKRLGIASKLSKK